MSSPTAVADGVAYEAARSGVGLARRTWRSVVGVGGEDHKKFLQGLLSNEVESLAAGAGCRALLLDVKGHVVVDFDVFVATDSLVLNGETDCLEAALATLQRYVLASAVTLDDQRGHVEVVGVVGPGAETLLRDAGIDVPQQQAGAHITGTIDGTDVRVTRAFASCAGLQLHVPAERFDNVRKILQDAAGEAFAELDAATSEVLRVEAGEPRWGAEITGEEFPQEAGLDAAISYDKGCYLGQETVARIHYRGQVNRLLRGLKLDARAAAGAELVHDGKRAGRITSVADSPRFGAIGLGYVRRDQADSGAALDVVQDGGTVGSATVVALPFQE